MEPDQTLDIDKIPDNSVIVFRFKGDPKQFNNMMAVIAERYAKKLKEKGVSVISVNEDVKIETLDEKMMGELGWKKTPTILQS